MQSNIFLSLKNNEVSLHWPKIGVLDCVVSKTKMDPLFGLDAEKLLPCGGVPKKAERSYFSGTCRAVQTVADF